MTERWIGAAPGKLILFGEHAVVFGRPAIAAPLSHGLAATIREINCPERRLLIPRWGKNGLKVIHKEGDGPKTDAISKAFVTALNLVGLDTSAGIEITIDGELPLGVGLGSSAAFSVCLLRVLSAYCGRVPSSDELKGMALTLERQFHGNPSGLDHSVIVDGCCVRFCAQDAPRMRPLSIQPLPLVISWTPRIGTTRDAVLGVNARHQRHPELVGKIFQSMTDIVHQAEVFLSVGNLIEVGQLMNYNHGLLNALGVSRPENEKLIQIARDAGALGAKLTGAGMGGAVIALAPNGGADRILNAFHEAGYPALHDTVSNH